MQHQYMGKSVSKMSKKELIKALETMNDLYIRELKQEKKCEHTWDDYSHNTKRQS